MGKGNSPHQSENDKILSLKVSPSHQRPLSPNFYCLPIRLLGSHHCYLEWGIKVREKVIKILYNKMRQFSRKPLKKIQCCAFLQELTIKSHHRGKTFIFPTKILKIPSMRELSHPANQTPVESTAVWVCLTILLD